MSLSKPKRSSFRIDDILSLKTSEKEQSEENNYTRDKNDIDRNASTHEIHDQDALSERFQIYHTNSHSSLLQEIGNRKRQREESIDRNSDLRFHNSFNKESRESNETLSRNEKIYPLTPKATKFPTSLESLMRTHASDYLLKLQTVNPWALLSNPCLGTVGLIPPPLLDLSASSRLDKRCLCGSSKCTESGYKCDLNDGPGLFMHPQHSPTTTSTHDAPSIPIPLPVYVRTRDVTGMENGAKSKKCRRSRTVFTELQLMGLEKKFETQKYLSTPDRLDIAERLGLTQLQVKTWYQNRRMKWKKQVLQGGGTEAPTKPKGRPRKDSIYEDNISPAESPSFPTIDSEDDELSDI